MSTMRTPLLIATLTVGAVVSVHSVELTPMERSHLVAHLEMTGSWLVDEVSNLSQEQLAFRPSPEVWSIMEVVEHLVVASICLLAFERGKTPRTILEQMFRRSVSDVEWQEKYARFAF